MMKAQRPANTLNESLVFGIISLPHRVMLSIYAPVTQDCLQNICVHEAVFTGLSVNLFLHFPTCYVKGFKEV